MAKGKASTNNKKVFDEDEAESISDSELSNEQSSADLEEAGACVESMSDSASEESSGYSSADDSEDAVGDDAAGSSVSEVSGSGASEAEDDETARTVFIKGLDYDATEETVRAELSKLGQIVRVHIPLTHDSRRNKGFAYVGFKRLSDAKKALKLNGSELMGRKVLVDQARPKTNFMIYTVFVRNLSFDTKRADLVEYFEQFGKVYNLSLPTDTANEDRNRGFCFVEYTDEETANKVASMKHKLNDRHLYCNLGNKNDDRNKTRSNDRLYGRRDDKRDNSRDSYRDRDNSRDRDSYRDRNDRGRGKENSKRVFDDSD